MGGGEATATKHDQAMRHSTTRRSTCLLVSLRANLFFFLGGRNSSLVVCWARCPT